MNVENAFPSDTADKVLVRMPEGMRKSLKDEAKANNRTMNAEIISRLESTFNQPAERNQEWQLEVEIRANSVRLDTAKYHLATVRMYAEMLQQRVDSLDSSGAEPSLVRESVDKLIAAENEKDDLQARIKKYLDESFKLDAALADLTRPRREQLDADAEKALQADYRAIGKSEDAMGLPDDLRQIKVNAPKPKQQVVRAEGQVTPFEADSQPVPKPSNKGPATPKTSAADRLRASLKPNKKGR